MIQSRQVISLRVGLWPVLVTLFILGSGPHLAQAETGTSNSTWNNSTPLRLPLTGQVVYGTLSQTGSSAFYTFIVPRRGLIRLTLSIPTWSSNRWQPQLVFYQPESFTTGPLLPMEQPPETLAMVYPSKSQTIKLDPETFVDSQIIQSTTLSATRPGRYYLAIYNAGLDGGRWRMEFEGPVQFVEIFRWPGQWWRDQAWAGWTLRTAFIPLCLLALSTLLIWHLTGNKKKLSRKHRKKL